MMRYEEFKNEIVAEVKKNLGDLFTVSIIKTQKNNGVVLEGLVAYSEDSKVSPTLYVRDFYNDLLDGKSFSTIVKKMAGLLLNCELPYPVSDLTDFTKVKNKICYALTNKNMSGNMLHDLPHFDYLDLSIYFYIQLDCGIVKIHNSLAYTWGQTADDLLDLAKVNTPQINPPVIKGMNSVIRELMKDDGVPEFLLPPIDGNDQMYVLSNEKNLQGAINFIESDKVEKLSQELDKNIYILPSSIHEVLLVPQEEGMSPDGLREMVCEVNGTQVDLEDQLSNSVYYYDRFKKQIQFAF